MCVCPAIGGAPVDDAAGAASWGQNRKGVKVWIAGCFDTLPVQLDHTRKDRSLSGYSGTFLRGQ